MRYQIGRLFALALALALVLVLTAGAESVVAAPVPRGSGYHVSTSGCQPLVKQIRPYDSSLGESGHKSNSQPCEAAQTAESDYFSSTLNKRGGDLESIGDEYRALRAMRYG